jgi:biopolymer transport protein ExbD
MHSHAPPRRRSSIGTIFVVLVLLGFFFLVGLLLLGVGAFVIARAESQQARAMAQRQLAQARAAEVQALEEMRREKLSAKEQFQQIQSAMRQRQATAPLETIKPLHGEVSEQSIRVANREITLEFDQQGGVQMDGKMLAPKELEAALRKAAKGRESAVIVTIKADPKCEFQYVGDALAICRKLDLPNVRITATD